MYFCRILAHKQLANEEAAVIAAVCGHTSVIPTRRSIALDDLPHAMVSRVVVVLEVLS